MQPSSNIFLPLNRLSNFIVHNLSSNYHAFVRYGIIIVISILIVWLVFTLLTKLIGLYHDLNDKFVFLEITPPQTTEISSVSTTQLFNLVLELMCQTSWLERLLLRQFSSSFEIVSSKEAGIRYILRVPSGISDAIEKTVRAYVPGTKVKAISDYLPLKPKSNQKVKILEYKQSRHFALPLNEHDDLKKHDPLAYLTGNMTHLNSDELLALQIILRPINGVGHRSVRKQIAQIKSLISQDALPDWLRDTRAQKYLRFIASVIEAIVRVLMIPILLLAELLNGYPPDGLPQSSGVARKVTSTDRELAQLMKAKLDTPLFAGTVRALLLINTKQLSAREKGLRSSFASFLHASGQALSPKWKSSFAFIQQLQWWEYRMRLGGSPVYLNASEVGALYHFPFKSNPESAELVRVRSRKLPAPLSLKNSDTQFDIVVGTNHYGNEDVPIGLTLEQRQKHMYVIGKTGMGKTTLLTSAIYQDMKNGKGLAVFDPHGDMLQELLGIIPESRRKDVIVFDPSDRDWPIGLNLLSPGVTFANIDDEKEWITSSVLGVFAKVTAKEYWGPRMEHILRNATMSALELPNPSLFTLQRLLTDKSYQKEVANKLDDPVLRQFWKKEFSLLGSMQMSSAIAPLTQRLGHFITSKMSRHILLQEKSTITMSEIMNEGKILLINLSKGDLGEDQSFFFGTILTSIIWMAAYQRTKIPDKKRRDFFVYVDEFQNFATPRFSEITSEGRKFHISLTASHQNIAQVEDSNILKIVAGNANTIICLKASPDDEKFILPFMDPEVEKGDIVNLPPYHFFMKVNNETSDNAFSGQTVPLEIEASEKVKTAVIKYSRDHFSTPLSEVEKYMEILFADELKSKQYAKPKKSKTVKQRKGV